MFTEQELNSLGFVKKKANIDTSLLDDIPISKIQKSILANRLDDVEISSSKPELLDFFYNSFDLFTDLEKLSDIDKGSYLIEKHINSKSHICVVVDYDSDGINSGVVLYRSLVEIFKVDKYKVTVIVNRRKDGNGFNSSLVSRIEKTHENKNIDLLITADHGSSDDQAFTYLKSKYSFDIILTDHHEIDYKKYPDTVDAFINPQRKDSSYYKEVSGCFVAFVTMLNTYRIMYGTKNIAAFNHIFPYVAISTITDVMSLKLPINRWIVKIGLNELNSYRNKVWIVIKNALGIGAKITPKTLGFKIGPLINTANRVDQEELAFRLLITDDLSKANHLASNLTKLNDYRKTITSSISKAAFKELEKNEYTNSIVLYVESSLSVNGIVAARVGSAKGLPTVCFLNNGDNREIIAGSCRAIVDGLDILSILKDVLKEDESVFPHTINPKTGLKEYEFGGHEGAAGCRIFLNKLERFRELFDKYAAIQLDSLPKSVLTEYDMFVSDFLVTPSLISAADACGPYGKNWPEPVFLTEATVHSVINMGSISKIVFKRRNNTTFEGIHFYNTQSTINVDNIKNALPRGTKVLLAFTVNLDTFMGVYSFLVNIVNIKPIEE